MTSLTRWVLAHKRLVVIGWIVLTIAGIAAAGPASKALKTQFSVPDKESWNTNDEIAKSYGSDRNGTSRWFRWSRSRRAQPSNRRASLAT